LAKRKSKKHRKTFDAKSKKKGKNPIGKKEFLKRGFKKETYRIGKGSRMTIKKELVPRIQKSSEAGKKALSKG